MAAHILPRGTPAQSDPSPSASTPPQFRHVYRAHVTPQHSRGVEVTAFVEAASREAAVRKISQAIMAIEFGATPESVADRIYNCSSAEELIAEGLSEDHAVRLFETSWSGDRAVGFVKHPLVLTADPAPLLRVWAQIAEPGERP
jgi:hypothetical protein